MAHSSAAVIIQVASAHDGVDIHDRGLPTAEFMKRYGTQEQCHMQASLVTDALRMA